MQFMSCDCTVTYLSLNTDYSLWELSTWYKCIHWRVIAIPHIRWEVSYFYSRVDMMLVHGLSYPKRVFPLIAMKTYFFSWFLLLVTLYAMASCTFPTPKKSTHFFFLLICLYEYPPLNIKSTLVNVIWLHRHL